MEPPELARINSQTMNIRQAYETLTSPAYLSESYVHPHPSPTVIPGPEPPPRMSLFRVLNLGGRPLPSKIGRTSRHSHWRAVVVGLILGFCLNGGRLMYGNLSLICGAAIGFLLARIVGCIWECFDPKPKGVVIQAAYESGDGDADEEAALSPRGELPIARMFERENSEPVEVGNGS